MLAKELDFPIWEYDPAIPHKDTPPRPADFVVCIDVLEHIEPDYLDTVLEDLARCTLGVGYLVICTTKSIKTLPDGRNTHLIVQDEVWWRDKISQYFAIAPKGIIKGNAGTRLHIIVSPKANKKAGINKLELKTQQVVNVNQATA